MSVRVEPTNAACTPSTAVLDMDATFVGSTDVLTDVKIFMWIMITVVKKTSVVLQTERNIIIHCRK